MRLYRLTLILAFVLICSFGSVAQTGRILSLEDCITIAIENNLTMKRGRLNLEGSKVNLNQASYSRLPNANLSGSMNSNWGRSIDPTTNQFIAQQITSSGFGGSSSVTLFSFMQQANNVKQNQLNVDAAGYDLEKVKNDLILAVAGIYLNVIFNKELVENAEFQLQSSQQQLDRTRILVESGALAKTNELDLVSQTASNEVALINQQNSLELALLDLKQSLLIPASEQIDIVTPDVSSLSTVVSTISPDELFEVSQESLPEIQSADLNVESSRYGVKAATGSRYPSLNAGAGFSTNYSDAFFRQVINGSSSQVIGLTSSGESVFTEVPNRELQDFPFGDQLSENLSWRLGLTLNIPLFNGLSAESGIQRSKIQLQQAEITAVEQRNILRQNIEQAYTNALAASKTFEASQRQVEALEESFRAVENQYNLGAANFTDYQIASNNLFGARSNLSGSKYDLIFKMKILDFYQGNAITFD